MFLKGTQNQAEVLQSLRRPFGASAQPRAMNSDTETALTGLGSAVRTSLLQQETALARSAQGGPYYFCSCSGDINLSRRGEKRPITAFRDVAKLHLWHVAGMQPAGSLGSRVAKPPQPGGSPGVQQQSCLPCLKGL
ncbi:hypothetical protein EYF80_041610 [Liparis tanakae]|uniref:Uncharacterized protein n=1 Tax=Liparis tanakae TaxID=230148 RepID=A0A4Z2G3T6_9TELE|nr:hypothetical protein EYF80_041610 [Liparis tanakae]